MRTQLCKTLLAVACVLIGLGCVSGQTVGEKTDAAQQAEKELLELAARKKVTLDFDNASLEYIVQFLKEAAGVNIIIDPCVDASALKLYAHLKDVSLATALKCLLSFEGLDYWATGQALVISTRDAAIRRRLEMRVYDVSDLVFQPDNFPQPVQFLKPSFPWLGYEVYSEPCGPDRLLDLIRAAAGYGTWDTEGCKAEEHGNNLFICHLPEVHAQIEYLLGDLRREREFQVRITGRVLEMDAGTANEAAAKKGAALTAADADKLLETVRKKGKVSDSFIVNCFNGQRNGTSSSQAHSYIADYDVQIAQKAVIAPPLVDVVFDALAFDFEPCVDATGEGVRLTVRSSIAKVAADTPSVTTSLGMVKLPTVKGISLATTLELANGSFAFMEAGTAPQSNATLGLLIGVHISKREQVVDKAVEQLFQDRAMAWKAAREKLSAARVSVDFKDAALTEVFDYLRKTTKFNFFIENSIRQAMIDEGMSLTLVLKDVSVLQALCIISDFYQIGYEAVDDVVALVSPDKVFEQPVSRRYYVADFLKREPDFYAPEQAKDVGVSVQEAMAVSAAGAGATATFAVEESAPLLSVDDLVELIRSNIKPESWDQPYVAIAFDSAFGLFIRHSTDVHEAVERLIGQFRGARRRMVNLDVRYLEVNKTTVAEMMMEAKGDKVLIGDESRRKLIDAALQSKNSQLWKGFNLNCMNGQRVYACDVAEQSLLAGYDCQIATEAMAYDPVVSKMRLGATVDFVGTIDAEGKGVKVEVRTYAGTAATPELVKTDAGDLQFARPQRLASAATATVPDGQTLVVFTTTPAPDLPDSVFLILVRTAIVK
ncbi:MAG: hypothetical protein RDV41_03495 [Planctomycetota bacterium]|nr:hypothetical protein [Planctomycetota bacterium]